MYLNQNIENKTKEPKIKKNKMEMKTQTATQKRNLKSRLTFDKLSYHRKNGQILNLNMTLQNALREARYEHLSGTQKDCIEPFLEKEDLAVYARTGSGKTLSMAIPIFNEILYNLDSIPDFNEIQGITINSKVIIHPLDPPYIDILNSNGDADLYGEVKCLLDHFCGRFKLRGRVMQQIVNEERSKSGYLIKVLCEIPNKPTFLKIFYPSSDGNVSEGDECTVDMNFDNLKELKKESYINVGGHDYFKAEENTLTIIKSEEKSNNSFLKNLMGINDGTLPVSKPLAVLVAPDSVLCRQLYDVLKSIRDKICKEMIINDAPVDFRELIAIQCPDVELQKRLEDDPCYKEIISDNLGLMTENDKAYIREKKYQLSKDIKNEINNGKIFDYITKDGVDQVKFLAKFPLIFIGTEERVFEYFYSKKGISRNIESTPYDGSEVQYFFIDEIVKSYEANKSKQIKKKSLYNEKNLWSALQAFGEMDNSSIFELTKKDLENKLPSIKSFLKDEQFCVVKKLVEKCEKPQGTPLSALNKRIIRFEEDNELRGLPKNNTSGWLDLLLHNSRGDNPFQGAHCTFGFFSGRYSPSCTKYFSDLLQHRQLTNINYDEVSEYIPGDMISYQQMCNGRLLKIVDAKTQEIIDYDKWEKEMNAQTVLGYIFKLEMFVEKEKKAIKGFFNYQDTCKSKPYHEFQCKVSLEEDNVKEINGEKFLCITETFSKQPLWVFQSERIMRLIQVEMEHQTDDFYIMQPERGRMYDHSTERKYISGSIEHLFDNNIFTLCQLCGKNAENEEKCKIIVFFESNEQVEEAMQFIDKKRENAGAQNDVLHVEFYNEFTDKVEKIQNGSARILISSKKFKNGLDLKNIKLVIITFPTTVEDYDQMAGRVERFENRGLVISLRSETEVLQSRKIYGPDGREVTNDNRVENYYFNSSLNGGISQSKKIEPWKIVKAKKLKEKEDFKNFYDGNENRTLSQILNSSNYARIFKNGKEVFEKQTNRKTVRLNPEQQKKVIIAHDSLEVISRDRFQKPGKIRNFMESVNKEGDMETPMQEKLTKFFQRFNIVPLNLIDELSQMKVTNDTVDLLLKHGVVNVLPRTNEDLEEYKKKKSEVKIVSREELEDAIMNFEDPKIFDDFIESNEALQPLDRDLAELEWIVKRIENALGQSQNQRLQDGSQPTTSFLNIVKRG